jgi:hypothetical protein
MLRICAELSPACSPAHYYPSEKPIMILNKLSKTSMPTGCRAILSILFKFNHFKMDRDY